MSATQVKLPGTLPSPKAARDALVRAARQLAECRATLAVLKEAAKVAREVLADAEDERLEAAADFENDNTPAASTRYLRAVESLRAQRTAVDGARLAVKEMRKAVRAAERAREAADEDLIAIAQGRRAN